MEQVKVRELSLRRFFVLTVFTTFGVVALLSGLTIWGCAAFRRYLLPDSDAAYLDMLQEYADGTVIHSTYLLRYGEETKLPRLKYSFEGGLEERGNKMGRGEESASDWVWENILDATYTIQRIERSYDALTPKRKLAYQLCGIAMVAGPAALSIGGILLCGFYFYRRKLSEPLSILSDATAQIADRNLDFSIEYACGDEMGALCRSFERMRGELAENNKAMWELLEQRRLMQASIAHDLRNPIAIIEGYTEYLQKNLQGGRLDEEKVGRIVNNLNLAAKRLEQYTESVRELNQLEDMEINRKDISSTRLMEEIRDDFGMMAAGAGVSLCMGSLAPECALCVDNAVVYRILENVFGNATRFAESTVSMDFRLEGRMLHITVADDGTGFPEEVLRKGRRVFLPSHQQDGHLGMGLAISRTLCEKHGGSLQISNADSGGAVAEIELAVS